MNQQSAEHSPTAWARNWKEATTPKLPPPPRRAQKRSSFSSALAVSTLPSAVTVSQDSTLSIVIPNFRISHPTPPPSVRPAIPVLETMPAGTASPKTWVSRSTSLRVERRLALWPYVWPGRHEYLSCGTGRSQDPRRRAHGRRRCVRHRGRLRAARFRARS